MERKIFMTAAFLGASAVVLGAFASHGLKNLVDTAQVQSFEIGVRYQMYHALFLLFVGLAPLPPQGKKWVARVVLAGVLCFCVSVYALATNALTPFFDFKKIALITPLGGLLLILGWTITLILFFRQKK